MDDITGQILAKLAALETDVRLIRTHGLPTCPAHGFMIEDHIARLKSLDVSTQRLADLMTRLENIAASNQTRIASLEEKVIKLEAAEGRRGLIVMSLSALGVGVGLGLGFVLKYLLSKVSH